MKYLLRVEDVVLPLFILIMAYNAVAVLVKTGADRVVTPHTACVEGYRAPPHLVDVHICNRTLHLSLQISAYGGVEHDEIIGVEDGDDARNRHNQYGEQTKTLHKAKIGKSALSAIICGREIRVNKIFRNFASKNRLFDSRHAFSQQISLPFSKQSNQTLNP